MLDYGADVTVKNQKGETAFDLIHNKTDISTESRQHVIELCVQYKECNRRDVLPTVPVLK